MPNDTLLIEDLRRSGIPAKYARKLKLKTLSALAATEFLGYKVPSKTLCYKIPFFDHRGKSIQFARLRLLEGAWHGKKFKKDKRAKPEFRYNQKANTAPHLYFPPVFKWPIKQKRIRLDYLCITEGEKKAVKACLCGIPTVALAGVYNYKSSKRAISLLEEFTLFDFSKTQIEICYDSDLHTNEQVRFAMNGLAAELALLSPKSIAFVMLDGDSTIDNRKGLDDFLAYFDDQKEARKAFLDLPRRADNRTDALQDFDKSLAFVLKDGLFYNIARNQFYKGRNQLFDEYEPMPKVPDPDNPRIMVAPIKLWFARRAKESTIASVTYKPGKPPRMESESGLHLNTWIDPQIIPKEGKPKLWLELFEHVTKELSQTEKDWLLQWFAYPLQNPGSKLFTSVFVYSVMHGVGKNFLVQPFLQRIYGTNWALVNGSELQSDFNAWAAEKQFIFLDEIYMPMRTERKQIMSDLRSLITNPTLVRNEKHEPKRIVDNYANIYIASNHPDAMPLDQNERRMMVIHAPEERLKQSFYREMEEWANNGGIGQLYNYLLNDVDCKEFNPHGDAPHTAARLACIDFSADNNLYLIGQLAADASKLFVIDGKMPDKELWTAEELTKVLNLYAAHVGMSQLTCSPQGLAMYLMHRAMLPRRVIKLRIFGHSTTVNLYAVFNKEDWDKRDSSDWLLHFKLTDDLRRFDAEVANISELKRAKK